MRKPLVEWLLACVSGLTEKYVGWKCELTVLSLLSASSALEQAT